MRRWPRLGLAIPAALALVWLARAPLPELDHTRIDSGVVRQLPPLIELAYTDDGGRTVRTLVDAGRYEQFVREAVATLELARLRLDAGLAARLEARVAPSFAAMGRAAPAFVDWYLAPGTGLVLAGVALSGLSDPAAAVQHRVASEYQAQVLRPAAHDPALRQAFVASLGDLTAARDQELDGVDRAFRHFVLTEARRQPDGEPVVALDWPAQSRRLALPRPPLPSGGLVGELPARLAGPALGLIAALGVGAEAGASFGWFAAPLGAAVGAGAGLAVDRAIAWSRRPAVEAEVHAALAQTQADWSSRMAGALTVAVDAWFDDAIQALPGFDQSRRRALSAAVKVPSSR